MTKLTKLLGFLLGIVTLTSFADVNYSVIDTNKNIVGQVSFLQPPVVTNYFDIFKTNLITLTQTNQLYITNIVFVTNSTPTTSNQFPIVSLNSPKNNSSFGSPASITLSATASDNDGFISKVEFYNGNSLLSSILSSPYNFTWNNILAGNYSLSARAYDNSNSVSTSALISISVTNIPPPSTNSTDIIPKDRTINWADSGIPNGIPNRTVIYKELTSIDTSGTVDVTSAIQSALNSCPQNQVVKLPNGIFRINGSLQIPSYVTLRGNGTNTILKSYGSVSSLFLFGTTVVPWSPTSISTVISGANAGANSITVTSTSGISVGSYLIITELNDPSYVSNDGSINGPATWVDDWDTLGTRCKGQIVEVTSINGTTIGISPSLYSSYTRTPWATRFNSSCKWAGVENLKTYANNTGTSRNFYFQSAAYCWVKNVECDFTDGDHVTFDWSYRCEVNHSYFHDSFIHSAGSFDNMIGLRAKTSGCLIIDNILRRLHTSVMLEWGAAGNVIAYNYTEGNYDDVVSSGTRHLPADLNSNHGAHPQFNLFEGNISEKFQADSFWGSSSDTTVFRNYLVGTGIAHPPTSTRGVEDLSIAYNLIQANRAIDIWEIQSKYNVVGNIVGSPQLLSRNFVRSIVSPTSRGYDNPPYGFSYGYISESDGGSSSALKNSNLTVIEHGNYDVKTGGIVWNPNISNHDIPNSLFLSGKPTWFGNLNWPAIDPANPSFSITNIPAGYRYVFGVDP
jgi:hypothetical protein